MEDKEITIYYSGTDDAFKGKLKEALEGHGGVALVDDFEHGPTGGFAEFDLGSEPCEHPEDSSKRDNNKPYYRDFVSGRRKGKFNYR